MANPFLFPLMAQHDLATLLQQHHLLDAKTALTAKQNAERENIPFISYIVRNKLLSSQSILDFCHIHFNLPIFELKNYDLRWLIDSIINTELICQYHFIPLQQKHHHLELGMSDPTNHSAISAISFHTGFPIQPVLIDEIELDEFIMAHCRHKLLSTQLETTLTKMDQTLNLNSSSSNLIESSDDDEEEPVIEFVNKLIIDAALKQISDIHIEPYENQCRIRFRQDGLLHIAANIPLHLANRITTRLKIMANLNIAEKRLPQDGHFLFKQERKFDVRVNSCPVPFGEKIVLRILDRKKTNLNIDDLGLDEFQKNLLLKKISNPQGLILITGPTGSGKTVTLYSILAHINQPEKNIVTVEDPIEIEMPGINQVNINPRIGLDFAVVLRSFLRQDPDIIMIGEIRDQETAKIALQAAQTGHLVFASLHTNNALDALMRLQTMGITCHHFKNSFSLIIAQRLIRIRCPFCKPSLTESFSETIQPCQHCHQGYNGRTGIFECLDITDELISILLTKSSKNKMNDFLRKNHWISLRDIGQEKIRNGVTTHEELERVLGNIY